MQHQSAERRSGRRRTSRADVCARAVRWGAATSAYLIDTGLGWLLRLAALLEEWDYKALITAYDQMGRSVLHPRVMLGIGASWDSQPAMVVTRVAMTGVARCRGMVDLRRPSARPQSIGKFIQLHSVILGEDFFVALVKILMSKLHLAPDTVGRRYRAPSANRRRILTKARWKTIERLAGAFRRHHEAPPHQYLCRCFLIGQAIISARRSR